MKICVRFPSAFLEFFLEQANCNKQVISVKNPREILLRMEKMSLTNWEANNNNGETETETETNTTSVFTILISLCDKWTCAVYILFGKLTQKRLLRCRFIWPIMKANEKKNKTNGTTFSVGFSINLAATMIAKPNWSAKTSKWFKTLAKQERNNRTQVFCGQFWRCLCARAVSKCFAIHTQK